MAEGVGSKVVFTSDARTKAVIGAVGSDDAVLGAHNLGQNVEADVTHWNTDRRRTRAIWIKGRRRQSTVVKVVNEQADRVATQLDDRKHWRDGVLEHGCVGRPIVVVVAVESRSSDKRINYCVSRRG